MQSIINRLSTRNAIKNIIGIFLGALGGFLYYYFIGCVSGTCAITSNPFMSILWGAAFGYLLFDMFRLKDNRAISDKE